jgi:peptide/nickel transport system substrate-binding protein
MLRTALGSYDTATGSGSNNRGRYSNVRLDALLNLGLRTIDADRRAALMRDAQGVAMRDVALIPLHYQANTWALRAGLNMVGRSDERIEADLVQRG